jgi:uncharacterized protein
MVLEEHGKRKEDEWVRENEKKLIEEMKRKREERIKASMEEETQKTRDEMKRLHHMHCPKCGHRMEELPLEGIKIDKCVLCEGIYFDRGELEELLQKKVEDKKNIFRKLLGI